MDLPYNNNILLSHGKEFRFDFDQQMSTPVLFIKQEVRIQSCFIPIWHKI